MFLMPYALDVLYLIMVNALCETHRYLDIILAPPHRKNVHWHTEQ